jgi:hypothetical protein
LIRTIFFLTLATWTASAQVTDASARAAAVRLAVQVAGEYRLAVPRESVVVARETTFALYSRDTTRTGPPMTAERESAEAQSIAALLGATARTGAASDYLRCVQSDCVTTTRFAVLVVHQAALFADGYRVSMQLWLPGPGGSPGNQMKQGSTVIVEEKNGGWAGVTWLMGSPVQPVRRIPPPE